MQIERESMKALDAETIEADRAAFLRECKRRQKRGALLSAIAIVVLFILPLFIPSPFGVMVMGFGSAILMTTYVYLQPESFRDRGGSLIAAICLVTAMWIAAVISTVFSLIGRH